MGYDGGDSEAELGGGGGVEGGEREGGIQRTRGGLDGDEDEVTLKQASDCRVTRT